MVELPHEKQKYGCIVLHAMAMSCLFALAESSKCTQSMLQP